MKRTIVFYLIVLPLIFSCHFKNHADGNLAGNEFSNKLIGRYDDKNLRLYITSPAKDSVELSLWSGTDNLVSGDTTVSDTGLTTVVESWKSGSDDISYKFTFDFDANDTDHIKLEWDSAWGAFPVLKSYTLKRKTFTYSPALGGDDSMASTRLLVDSDVNNLFKDVLESMRNEIYARHGYCFKDADWRTHFEYTDWYIPYSPDVSKDLTDIEKKNITLIKKYEKTAKDEDFDRQ